MHRHLVAVKVGVKRRTDQGVNLNRFALDQHRLKGLNPQAVQSGGAVKQHRMVFHNIFQDLKYHCITLVDEAFGALHRLDNLTVLQLADDKRLEQFNRHLLGQAALIEPQLGPHHHHRTAGIVNALAQQVQAETALLAAEHIGERLQRTIAVAAYRRGAFGIVKQRIHRFLKHALLIAENHFRRLDVHQLFQAIIANNHPAVEVVQVAGGKAAAFQRHQGAQFRRNDRNHIQHHPLGLVLILAIFPGTEGFHHFQTFERILLFLLRFFRFEGMAQFFCQGFHIDQAQHRADPFPPHHRQEFIGMIIGQFQLFHAQTVHHLHILVFQQKVAGFIAGIPRLNNHVRFVINNLFQILRSDI